MGVLTKGETGDTSVVLVAVDLSPISAAVVQSAVSVAGARAIAFHLVHVLQPQPPDLVTTEHFSKVVEQTKTQLDALTHTLPDTVLQVVVHIRAGEAQSQIAQCASEIGADLIVVGTHGHKGIDRLLLGSVANALVRSAPCPVLTYRPKPEPASEQIAPPCADCLAVREATGLITLWCERHSQHHPRAHTYHDVPSSYGVGAQTFR